MKEFCSNTTKQRKHKRVPIFSKGKGFQETLNQAKSNHQHSTFQQVQLLSDQNILQLKEKLECQSKTALKNRQKSEKEQESYCHEVSTNSSVSTIISKKGGKNQKTRQQRCQKSQRETEEIGQDQEQNHFFQFISYLMEFKLQIKDSYISQQRNQQTKGKERAYRTQQNKQIKKITFGELEERCLRKSQIHYDYSCDNCNVEPIIGKRYHCCSEDCHDDFDLCQECFPKVKHPHILYPLTQNQLKRQIQGINKVIEQQKCFSKSQIHEHKNIFKSRTLWKSHIN